MIEGKVKERTLTDFLKSVEIKKKNDERIHIPFGLHWG